MSKRSRSSSNKDNGGEKKTKKDFTVSWKDIADILIDRLPKQLVETGLDATSKEIAYSLTNIRLVCRGWREVVDQSIPWTAAKIFYNRFATTRRPFLTDVLYNRQMTLLSSRIGRTSDGCMHSRRTSHARLAR